MTLEAGLTLTEIETVASNFLEEYGLTYSNAEYYTDFLTLSIRFEGPNNWTIGMEVDLEDIETVEELTKEIEHEYLREIEYTSVDEYFNEMYDNVSREFTASEFLRMLEEDMKYFQSVVKKINGVEENVITGDILTILYNLEQMDFTSEEILMRLEDCLKGYEFELDTEDGDTISLVRGL